MEGGPWIKVWFVEEFSCSYSEPMKKYYFRWWSDLCKVCRSEKGNNWFDSNVSWQVGSGSIITWEDVWLDNNQLKVRFPKIFNKFMLKDKPHTFGS